MSYLLRSTIRRLYLKCGNATIGSVKPPAVCQLCSRPVDAQARWQTTSTNPEVFMKRMKKRKKTTDHYSDVIKVASNCGEKATEERTIVKKSPPEDIMKRLGVDISEPASTMSASSKSSSSKNVDNLLTSEPVYLSTKTLVDMLPSLSEFEKDDGSDFQLVVNQENPFEDVVVDPASLEHLAPETDPESVHEEVEQELLTFPLQSETKSKTKRSSVMKRDQDKLFKTVQRVKEQQSKDAVFGLTLRSFLDVCISCNMVGRAHNTLLQYLSKLGRSKIALISNDVHFFNVILIAAAQQANLTCVQQLMSRMRGEGLKPNLETYAGCFSCVSRLPNLQEEFVRKLFEDVKKDGLNLANLDKECSFVSDQREHALKAIRLVSPNFEPDRPDGSGPYVCNLLSSLNEEPPKDHHYNPNGGTVAIEDLMAGAREQLLRELSGDVTVRSIQTMPEPSENVKQMKIRLEVYERVWRKILLESFKNRVKNLEKQSQGWHSGKTVLLYPFLVALDPSSYVSIMLEEIRRLAESSENFSLPRMSLHSAIGVKVMMKYLVKTKQQQGIVEKIDMLYKRYCQYYVDPELTSQYNPRQYWQKLCSEHLEGPSIDAWDVWWPNHILCGVGRFLYDILIQEVKINVNCFGNNKARPIPAFYSIYRYYNVKVREEIKPHPVLVKLFRMTARENLTFLAGELPMLSPPLPWASLRSGGYLLSSAKLIRVSHVSNQRNNLLDEVSNNQMFPIYDSLNQLGECAWIVNEPVLDVIIEVFNNNGDDKLEISPPASACPPLPQIQTNMSTFHKAKLYQERNKLKQKKADMHSLWCDTLYKLSIANHFREKVFWFPYNLDFRGRVYPVPPHFNHLGNDVTRSVLLFAKGEPLGNRGLDWLKIQIVNLTGLKKRDPISERLRFANEMMDEILDSADRPLGGRKWWQNSDEPWQALACCIEVAKAVRSPDPSKYICHLPIHQDGSCNGLQHYAALGRDQHGAEQVNLCPLDTPQDIYSGVAQLVEKQRVVDAANGIKIAQILEGHVKRKVIKQTVMTTVYGVTRFGSRLQIIRQLKDLADFPQDKVFVAASYLSQKTFSSLQQMFTSAKEIQDWFTDSARQISQVCGQPVEWVTPLGLPVIQPYQKTKKLSMPIVDINNYLTCDILQKPNVVKQRNAFPPNFIHSLDSTHMMLTSLYCQRAGITFVSVHDCFWTHPSTVHIMNEICREQFVALHSEPILEDLALYLYHKFSYSQKDLTDDGSVIDSMKRRLNRTLMRIPQKGTFNLENVLNSTYFFS